MGLVDEVKFLILNCGLETTFERGEVAHLLAEVRAEELEIRLAFLFSEIKGSIRVLYEKFRGACVVGIDADADVRRDGDRFTIHHKWLNQSVEYFAADHVRVRGGL